MMTYSPELFFGVIEILSIVTGLFTVALSDCFSTPDDQSSSLLSAWSALWAAHQRELENSWQPLPCSPGMSCYLRSGVWRVAVLKHLLDCCGPPEATSCMGRV